MIKIINFVELPIVRGALLESPKSLLRAFLFYPSIKTNMAIIKEMNKKIALFLPGGQGLGQKSLVSCRWVNSFE